MWLLGHVARTPTIDVPLALFDEALNGAPADGCAPPFPDCRQFARADQPPDRGLAVAELLGGVGYGIKRRHSEAGGRQLGRVVGGRPALDQLVGDEDGIFCLTHHRLQVCGELGPDLVPDVVVVAVFWA